jgi:type IV secretion system protein VirD4
MIAVRLFFLAVILATFSAVVVQWHYSLGFNAADSAWWRWLPKAILSPQYRDSLVYPIWWTGGAMLALMLVGGWFFARPGSRTISGSADARFTHGSARWAKWRDVVRAELDGNRGVVVGGWKKPLSIRPLRHDGPEHILAFAPTRSGKGVGLVVTTMLSWPDSALVLDIKGENFNLTAGWRAKQGQRVLKFEPSAVSGSVRYNPLAEVRVGTGHAIADCQNISLMIIDPDGKGIQGNFWREAGWEWLSAVVLHVLYRAKREGRIATLVDVHAFMSVGDDEDETDVGEEDDEKKGNEGFNRLLDDMARYDHGDASVNDEVRRGASRMRKRAHNERSGVHSSASVPLALFSDPIVAANIAASDFCIADLVSPGRAASLYIVIPPSDILRLRPLIRIMVNQYLTRLTADLPKPGERRRLLLMLDEFTSIGKLEIFEKALAFMAGYGLKAYIIVQDLTQLQKEYGKEEAISSNCHVRIAYAPNKLETAKVLSDMTGKTTLVQSRRSRSWGGRGGGNVSDSIAEVARPLMTADEVMSLPGIRKGWFGRIIPGHMMIFVAGQPPIYGRQWIYLNSRDYRRRAALQPPKMVSAGLQPANNSAGEGDAYRQIVERFQKEARS